MRGIGLMGIAWLLFVGAYAYVLRQRIDDNWLVLVLALIGGTFCYAFVLQLAGIYTYARDRRAIRRAMEGLPPIDGKLAAAYGPIRARGKLLKAPFTGRPCVAYDYKVASVGSSDRAAFWGVRMASCAVESTEGPRRILGWVMLNGFPTAAIEDSDVERGVEYLKSVQPEEFGALDILSTLRELTGDNDGVISKDYISSDAEFKFNASGVTETILPAGQMGTVVGFWSGNRGGFTSAEAAVMNRIFLCDLKTTLSKLREDHLSYFAIVLVFFILSQAFVWTWYATTNRGSGDMKQSRNLSVWDVRNCAYQKELLDAGANPNETLYDGITPLMNSARLGEVDCVEHLIKAGARLEAEDKDGDTALAQAVMANRPENVEALRKAGAIDFRLNSDNGRPVSPDSEPYGVIGEFVAAIHKGDFKTMARILIGSTEQSIANLSENLPTWKELNPQGFNLSEGWINETDATITVVGAPPNNDRYISYHLKKQDGRWQIKRQWYPEVGR